MRPGQARFVTACQQMLVLGVVVALLTPAASVISLEVVGRDPHGAVPSARPGLQAYRASAEVPTVAVDPVVHEYSLTAPTQGRVAAGGLQARVRPGRTAGRTEITGVPQPVSGFGAVGVTWAHGTSLTTAETRFEVRTRTGATWSGWTKLVYDAEHGPDPGSREAAGSRPGTDPLLVGRVDQVQVRAELPSRRVPHDLRLAVIDPGNDTVSRRELPAIDTAELGSVDATGLTRGEPVSEEGTRSTSGGLALQAATYTTKPRIFSRAQWGADERMREKSSLHYYEVHAGFVHHTVNANNYTRADVPALIRGIYAYHTRSRGWSDIGYNFLVDRFGRIWEGRYGGVDRPVVGAHTLGYNDYAFAMSAIGNFETAQPRDRMLRAYGSLFAWKLSLHGIDASSTDQVVGPSHFQAINGHRDAAATACPGRNLYARLPTIRRYAAEDQAGWSGRELESNLAGTPHPDLIVRRATDGQTFVLPTEGLTAFARRRMISTGWTGSDTVVATPDVTGDGRGDLAVRGADGVLQVYPGDGRGGIGDPVKPTDAFRGRDQISAVGDLDEDGHNDLIGRNPDTGTLNVYLGGGRGGFVRRSLGSGWGGYSSITGAGDLDGDGHVDIVARDPQGRLWLRRGTGSPRVEAPTAVAGQFGAYDVVTGFGDYDQDGLDDLFVRVRSTGQGFVLPADGRGGYRHRLGPVTRARGLAGVSGADLAGTSEPDLVGRVNGRLVLLRNAGTTETGRLIPTGMRLAGANTILNVGDWNRDGYGDVIARSAGTGVLRLRLGDGQGRFGKPIRIGTGFATVRLLAAVGDMTGDGWPDLMGMPKGGALRIYPGAGVQGLRPSYVAYGTLTARRQIGVGRWDRDGAPDSLMRSGGTLRLYPGNGPGGLVNKVTTFGVNLKRYDWVVGVSDVTLGGHPDLVVREKATGYLWLLPGTPTGFAPRRFLAEGFGGYDKVG